MPNTTSRAFPQQAGAVPTPAAETRPRWSPARLAYWFYAVAATGAVIGQTWVALTHVPWTPTVPGLARVAAVLPFALCLELLAMALSAMADERMRLGERAYGFRTFSAVVATVAVGILVAGHWPHLYWSAGFGVLSASAYLLWLLHSAARRRDALRAAGKLADTAPDYGLWRRVRHPIWTARAAELACEGCLDAEGGRWRPLGLFESLRAAELAIRAEKRRPAIAHAVEQVVRADQRDPRMAEIAVRTLDLDRLAAELARQVDYGAWADRLAPAITAPPPTTHAEGADSPAGSVPTAVASRADTDRTRVPAAAPVPALAPAVPIAPVAAPPAPAPVMAAPVTVATVAPVDSSPTGEGDRPLSGSAPLSAQEHINVDAPYLDETPASGEPHPAGDETADGRGRDGEAGDDSDADPYEGHRDGHDLSRDATLVLAPDLVPLLPAARAARDELTSEGRTVSRDALARRLRRNGHSIRNSGVSELLAALRQEARSVNGSRPTTSV